MLNGGLFETGNLFGDGGLFETGNLFLRGWKPVPPDRSQVFTRPVSTVLRRIH